MQLRIDLTSEIPLYQQLRDQVVEAIATGTLTLGSSLPSTRQLAADFGINFHTVNKAYDLLRREDFIWLGRKRGAYVTRDHESGPPDPAFVRDWEARARTLLAEAYAQGMASDEILARCSAVLAGFAAGPSREDNESDLEGGVES